MAVQEVEILGVIREKISAKRQERAQLVEGMKGLDKELRGLLQAERALDPSAEETPRESNLDAVRKFMETKGTATMAEVAVGIGKTKNTAKSALTRLETAGEVKKTGRVVARSPEYEFTAAA